MFTTPLGFYTKGVSRFSYLMMDRKMLQLGSAMPQALSRRPVTEEVRFRSQDIRVGFAVEEMTLGQVFITELRRYLDSATLSMLHPVIYPLRKPNVRSS